MAINQQIYKVLLNSGIDFAVAASLADNADPNNPIVASGAVGPAGPAGPIGPAGLGALTPIATSVSITCSAGQFVLATGGTTGITVTLPAPVSGTTVVVKKVDSGAGAVVVTATVGSVIDGTLTRSLGTQNTSIRMFSDGSNWYTF